MASVVRAPRIACRARRFQNDVTEVSVQGHCLRQPNPRISDPVVFMKNLFSLVPLLVAGVALTGATVASAATLTAGAGYTNDFSVRPDAIDWSTRSFGSGGMTGAGEVASATAMDTAVQTNSAALITAQCASATGNPPNNAGTATWASAGGYLQTRPTGTAVTLLLLTLLNNTGTNATGIRVSYDYVTNRTASVAEEVRGHRVYYSLTGVANSWSNITALSQTAQGTLSVDLTLSGTWAIGGNLYLLWADDNGSGAPDDPNDIDNFFVTVIAGAPLAASCQLAAPLHGRSFPDTNAVTLTANAGPGPGATNTGVGFYEVTSGLLGSVLVAPYTLAVNPAPGTYQIYAVATNSLDVVSFSGTNTITVTNVPFSIALLTPANNTTHGTPTNVAFSASAYGGNNATITGVAYFDVTNGFIADALAAPFAAAVAMGGGAFRFYALATNSLGATVASGTNTVVINVPPTNTLPPVIFSQNPPHSTPQTNLTNLTVTFSEPVTGVDAFDLLVNGVPATGVTGSGSNYTFTFPRPAYGEVSVAWTATNGITDFGWPVVLPFDPNGSGAQWGYYLFDQTPPVVAARVPASGVSVTNIEQVSVTFSEAVSGVDAADLLLNGSPATGVTGGGSNYIFTVAQPPASGPLAVNVTWATNHGIADLAATPNAFNATNAGAAWSFTLDPRTVLVQSNATWKFIKGFAEASIPTNGWRQLAFDDSSWSNAPAPFFYGDPYSNGLPAFTLLSDMQSNYSTIYLRRAFTVPDSAAITNLLLNLQVDDGAIVWLNGTEVLRANAPAGEAGFNGVAPAQSTEPNNNGSAYVSYTLTNAAALLVNGANVLTVHALNQSLTGSSDFGFNAQLYTYTADAGRAPPRLLPANPPSGGEVLALSSVTVTFSEVVTGVDAGDLLVNGTPSTGLTSAGGTNFTFTFAQPAPGVVTVSWATNHGIADLDMPPQNFDGAAPAAILHYSLINADAPVVAAKLPAAGSTLTSLGSVAVAFSESVTGVNAADLLVNGSPASGVSGSGATYAFTFTQPAFGPVAITWAANPGIQDLGGNAFDGSRAVNQWSYTVVDVVAPEVASQNPPAGSALVNLTQVTVTFSESVTGVNASDLLINGTPASSVSGSGTSYTFGFAQPNATLINVTWAVGHGIRDLAAAPNAFDATAAGAMWTYSTFDSAPPTAGAYPPPFATVKHLKQISVQFNEPVAGVDAADLLINDTPAVQVTGSGAGPYTFSFSRPTTGEVQVAFAVAHGIHDLASPPNAYPGGVWSYTLNPALPIDIAVSHVVQMSLDGLGAKYLQRYVAGAPDQFPNFVRLMNEGAFTFNARCDYDISETIPNHATMFTGRPVFQPAGQAVTTHHGYNNNFPAAADTLHNSGNTNVSYKASMFDVAHDYGRTTAFYAGKTRLGICDRSFDGLNGALDLIGADNGRDKIDFASVADVSGASISNEVNSVVADLTSAAPSHYVFIHIAEPDITGHASSWGSANWSNAVRNVDAQLGRIITAIDSSPALAGQTALLVTADHGGGGVTANAHTESYHITNYTIPFFLRAPGIAGGTDLYALFANRGDPGTNRTDYNTAPQPVRNGDGSNLALSLLALPPIPGSSMAPAFATPAITLHVARFGALMSVFWTDPYDDYVLEAAGELASPVQWQPVTSGIAQVESTKTLTITNAPGAAAFFRLRRN